MTETTTPVQGKQTPPRLSKSRFVGGCQCPLKLWYDCYERQLATPPSVALQAVFDTGHEVGELAQQRWPGGTLVSGEHWQVDEALIATDALLNDVSVPAIYEAALIHRGVLTRVDILVRNVDGSWDLVEVKSSTRVKAPYDTDLAIQYWILNGAGLSVRRAGILTLNRSYQFPGGDLDLQQLFKFHDLTDDARSRLGKMEQKVVEFQQLLTQPTAPVIAPGLQCNTPYNCSYYAHCTRDIPAPDLPLSILSGLHFKKRQLLEAQGIDDLADIPDGFALSAMQQKILESTLSNTPAISGGLDRALNDVQWPMHYLDFESAGLAVPRFPGTHPFDAVPFQFSCHHQDSPGTALRHTEFLAMNREDPRRPLAEALLKALGNHGSIVVYSPFEARMIRELAAVLPELADALRALLPRLVDLLKIVREHYYHPDFRGSFSIKAVMPALIGDLGYKTLEIADGLAASGAWQAMWRMADGPERSRLAQALLAYCGLDSLAMYKVREALLRTPS